MRLLLLATLTLPIFACNSSAPAETSSPLTEVGVEANFPGWDNFGGNFLATPMAEKPVLFSELAANPETFDGKRIQLLATIDEVCQAKGCWMTFTDGDSSMRVKFKDYAFFMPKDASGRQTLVEGEFKIQIVPAAEVAHYLEDAGKIEEASEVTEDQMSLTFEASAVLIKK
jgi:hypothetical protein